MVAKDVTYLEKTMSKNKLTEKIEIPAVKENDPPITEKIEISWNIIDNATSNYAKLLQEYDISEIVKSFYQRYGKSKMFHALPKPGNLDITDTEVGFKPFMAFLDAMKSKNDIDQLRDTARPIISYLLSGKHSKADKRFMGWKNAFAAAKKAKKNVLLGILSVDLPTILETPKGSLKYKCSGTQHYTGFAFDIKNNKLFMFDSAAKDPIKEKTETYYILRFLFEELVANHETTIDVFALKFRNVLQPGAGDKKEEDERSYNNQNVFCHTWSLWFCLVFIVFYATDQQERVIRFLQSLSHRNPALNLAMIKRFAGWITAFLSEDDKKKDVKFPHRIFEKAKEKADHAKVQQLLTEYANRTNPYMGLNYIWNYKTKAIMKVERLCLRRKVKLDVDLLDRMDKIDINTYIEKSKEIRCPIGYNLNEKTKRCRKESI